jgi:hypothetical protein
LVELLDRLNVHQSTGEVVDLNPVVNPQPRRKRRTEEVPSIRRPLAVDRVRRLERDNLLERLTVVDVDLTREVTETGDAEEATLRVVGDEVTRVEAEVGDDLDALVEDNGLGGHVCRRERMSKVREGEEEKEGRETHIRT